MHLSADLFETCLHFCKGLVLEKEYLVLEIHHRVKNNLQTTMSLLNMQSESISDKKALNAIRDSQRRMYTMSLLHNRLYQLERRGSISMNVYIGKLQVYLFESLVDVESVKLET
jgi:two-component sensor histidine kinase